MRVWTGAGLVVALVVLVAAVVVAMVVALGDGDGDGQRTSQDATVEETRGEGVIRATPPPELTEAEHAEQDSDPALPGTFYPSQGRQHFSEGFVGHAMTLFCASVARYSESSDPAFEIQTVGPMNRCYESNPPSSGRHLGVERNVDIGGGIIINSPPDPDVYPHDMEIPRDAIPHILEHAGVFVGHHCADGDAECEAVVARIEDLVNQHIDEGDRVVMARDTDLPVGEIGVASWTRVLNARWDEVEVTDVRNFIDAHSCRFDPEGFCR